MKSPEERINFQSKILDTITAIELWLQITNKLLCTQPANTKNEIKNKA